MENSNSEVRSDAELWLEAVSGTSASFAVLYDRHKARVFRKAFFRVRNVADAEDVTAMVFLEAWRSRAKVRIVEGSLLPWLLVVTSNVSLNSERSRRRYRRLLARLPPGGDEPDPTGYTGERLDAQRRANALTAALKRLSPAERTVVDLCLVEELPLLTVAGALDIPLGTVKSRLHTARRKLRTSLSESDIHLGEFEQRASEERSVESREERS